MNHPIWDFELVDISIYATWAYAKLPVYKHPTKACTLAILFWTKLLDIVVFVKDALKWLIFR